MYESRLFYSWSGRPQASTEPSAVQSSAMVSMPGVTMGLRVTGSFRLGWTADLSLVEPGGRHDILELLLETMFWPDKIREVPAIEHKG